MLDKNKKNHNFKKKFRLILIFIVAIYLMFQIVPVLQATKLKTYVVTNAALEIVEEVEAIVFKEEKVYKSDITGEIVYYIQEGERVGARDKIAEIPINSNTKKLKDELQDIEEQIENLSNTNLSTEIFKNDIEKNQQNIDNLIKRIGEAVINKEYKEVANLRLELNEKLDKQKALTGQTGYSANRLQKLKDRRKEIITEMENLNFIYNAQISGIVSYSIDGLEMIYTPNKLADFYPKNFEIMDENLLDINARKNVKAGEPIYKIIDNYEWYIAGMITNKEIIQFLNNKSSVYIRLDDSDHEIKTEIFKVNSEDDKAVLVLRLNKLLYEFHKKRFVNLKIILDKFEGLKIPTESIVVNNGIHGVYIKGTGGITKFRAIEILGQSGEYTIVKELSGSFESPMQDSEDGKTRKIYYLSIYDEVLIDGNKVTEGEIIN